MLSRIPTRIKPENKLARIRRAFQFLLVLESIENKILAPLKDKKWGDLIIPGIARRASALAIDNLLLIIAFLITLQLTKFTFGDTFMVVGNTIVLFILIVTPLYNALACFCYGRTVGKAVMDIEVKSSKGNKVSVFQSMLREVSKLIFMPLALISLVMTMICRRRVLHDYISSTLLIVNPK